MKRTAQRLADDATAVPEVRARVGTKWIDRGDARGRAKDDELASERAHAEDAVSWEIARRRDAKPTFWVASYIQG
jgi:hypothetical protein